MASIALPLPFRRLLLKIRTTPPCAQRLLILSINESRRPFTRGYSTAVVGCDVQRPLPSKRPHAMRNTPVVEEA
jgi:hypothetical protein